MCNFCLFLQRFISHCYFNVNVVSLLKLLDLLGVGVETCGLGENVLFTSVPICLCSAIAAATYIISDNNNCLCWLILVRDVDPLFVIRPYIAFYSIFSISFISSCFSSRPSCQAFRRDRSRYATNDPKVTGQKIGLTYH